MTSEEELRRANRDLREALAFAERRLSECTAQLATANERVEKPEVERAGEWNARRDAESRSVAAFAAVEGMRAEMDRERQRADKAEAELVGLRVFADLWKANAQKYREWVGRLLDKQKEYLDLAQYFIGEDPNRDARMKAAGAAEWLRGYLTGLFHMQPEEYKGAALKPLKDELTRLEAEAARFREGK